MEMENAVNTVRDYLQCKQELYKADVILVLGSADTRVAIKAAQLYNEWYAPLVITTGNSSKVRTDVIVLDKPEADRFAEMIIEKWVPADKIIIENKSTNTWENIKFAYENLKDKNIKSIIIVHKPYAERRALATFEKQRPDQNTSFLVTSLPSNVDTYCEWFCDKEYLINMMIGDLQRIIEYPKLWFQTYQEVPDNVIAAYEYLKNKWYTKQLMKE